MGPGIPMGHGMRVPHGKGVSHARSRYMEQKRWAAHPRRLCTVSSISVYCRYGVDGLYRGRPSDRSHTSDHSYFARRND